MLPRHSHAVWLFLAAAAVAAAGAQEKRTETLTILAPGGAGGSYDQTARALRDGLLASNAAARVEIEVSPGASGMVGLAQFLARRGDEQGLFVGGLALLSAIRAQQARVALHDATPLARLAGEHQVVVVAPGSALRSLADLLRELRRDPERFVWAGGPQGSADNDLVVEIAEKAGVPRNAVSYLPVGLTGEEVAETVVGGHAVAGVSWYSELSADIESGRLRGLAIAAPERVPSIALTTFREQGLDVVATNWRGVFAAPGLAPTAVERLAAAVSEAVRSDAWRAALRHNRWTDLYQEREAFTEFVRAEVARIHARPAPPPPSAGPLTGPRTVLRWLAAGGLAAAALGLLLWRRARLHERSLEHDLDSLRLALQEALDRDRDRSVSVEGQIQGRFADWGLTPAERDVATMILKGQRYRDIAAARKTSERTVREQAFGVFKKAGLAGRSDLAAFFLKELLQPGPAAAPDGDGSEGRRGLGSPGGPPGK